MASKAEIGIKGGKISPMRQVPTQITRPEYVGKSGPSKFSG